MELHKNKKVSMQKTKVEIIQTHKIEGTVFKEELMPKLYTGFHNLIECEGLITLVTVSKKPSMTSFEKKKANNNTECVNNHQSLGK